MKTICLLLVSVFASCCATGCATATDAAAAGPPPGSYTSIAFAPASVPCCAPTAAPARPAGVRPGEVWCYVKVPGESCTNSQQVLIQPGRWEWKRTTDCEVPGATPDSGKPMTGVPQTRTDLQGVRPGEVWCSVWIPPVYETKTTVTQQSTDRWEWRRTRECDVPASR